MNSIVRMSATRFAVLTIASMCWLVVGTAPAAAEEGAAEPSEASAERQLTGEPAAVDVALGPLVMSRSLEMSLESRTTTHKPQLYVGGTLRIGAELYRVDASGARLAVEAEGGYAAGRNNEEAAELDRAPVTEASFLHTRLNMRRPLGQTLALDVGLGLAIDSFIVEPNLSYTGHRYIAGELRAGLGWRASAGGWSASADISALPALSVDQSGGAHGDGSAFGARLGAQVGFEVLSVPTDEGYRGGQVLVRYDYSRFRTQFPEARLGLNDGVSLDQAHALVLMFGYAL
ncbi:MAG: hypothetical protein ACOC9W_03790 [Persicimonas sp.]